MGIVNSHSALVSSENEKWGTPTKLFNKLHEYYHFDIDVCASDFNHKLDNYYTEQDDALKQDWAPLTCWMNPPYGRGINKWFEKAYNEASKGATVVALVRVPSIGTSYHIEYGIYAKHIFIPGRLHFEDDKRNPSKSAAPFSSMLLIWDKETIKQNNVNILGGI